MTNSPYISISFDTDFNYSWLGDSSTRATLIFSKNLDYNKTLSRKKINIHIGDEDRIETTGSIKSIWIKKAIDTSQQLNEVDKINFFLKIIYQAVMTIAEIEGWDTTTFEEAYQRSIADNGNFIWHSKLRSNKNRALKARIRISLDRNGKVPIVAEFFESKSNRQFEIPIIDTFLHSIEWEHLFQNPQWLDNEKFGFDLLNSQLLLFGNTNSRQSETVISENKLNREEIEGEIRRITFRHFSNNKEYVAWASR